MAKQRGKKKKPKKPNNPDFLYTMTFSELITLSLTNKISGLSEGNPWKHLPKAEEAVKEVKVVIGFIRKATEN